MDTSELFHRFYSPSWRLEGTVIRKDDEKHEIHVKNLKLIDGSEYDITLNLREYKHLQEWHRIQLERSISRNFRILYYLEEVYVREINLNNFGCDEIHDINQLAVKILCNNNLKSKQLYECHLHELYHLEKVECQQSITREKFPFYYGYFNEMDSSEEEEEILAEEMRMLNYKEFIFPPNSKIPTHYLLIKQMEENLNKIYKVLVSNGYESEEIQRSSSGPACYYKHYILSDHDNCQSEVHPYKYNEHCDECLKICTL